MPRLEVQVESQQEQEAVAEEVQSGTYVCAVSGCDYVRIGPEVHTFDYMKGASRRKLFTVFYDKLMFQATNKSAIVKY